MSDQSLYLLTDAAERTGLTVEALRQRIKRGRLDAVKGNDGMLRVRLTTADLEALGRSSTGQAVLMPAGQPVNVDRFLRALQDAAEARGEAEAVRERAKMAEAESATLREQIKVEREGAENRLRRSEEARVAAETELADWSAGGPLARAWRAFLWRRGRR